jgi:hypothetical protein
MVRGQWEKLFFPVFNSTQFSVGRGEHNKQMTENPATQQQTLRSFKFQQTFFLTPAFGNNRQCSCVQGSAFTVSMIGNSYLGEKIVHRLIFQSKPIRSIQ